MSSVIGRLFFVFYCLEEFGVIKETLGQEEVKYVSVYEPQVSWSAAESYCIRTYGTHLASIEDSTANTAALTTIPSNALAWIGLNDEAIQGTFEWTDGTSFDSSNYNEWNHGTGEGQANNPSENCVSFYTNGYWIDIDCNITAINYFICNMPKSYVYVFLIQVNN